jgi:hypothetical protein
LESEIQFCKWVSQLRGRIHLLGVIRTDVESNSKQEDKFATQASPDRAELYCDSGQDGLNHTKNVYGQTSTS